MFSFQFCGFESLAVFPNFCHQVKKISQKHFTGANVGLAYKRAPDISTNSKNLTKLIWAEII